MKTLKMFVLVLSLVSANAWGQEATRWTIVETRAGKDPKTITYQRTLTRANEQDLTCQKEQRIQTTILDGSGSTVRWTKKSASGNSMELIREGREFVSRTAEGTTRFPSVDFPWFQDLHQLGEFVLSHEKEVRFVAFADFLDARLKASDMTVFRATKVRIEPQKWGSGSGSCWRVRVTFDDFRSAFWGADYWFRASDGRLVRYEEVRGGPGTPVTVGVLASEEP